MRTLRVTVLLLLTLAAPMLQGQSKGSQVGFRSGLTSGIFYQFQTNSGNAESGYNAMLSFRNQGAQLTVLKIFYELSLDELSPDLYLVWGFGGHAGFYVANSVRFLGEPYYLQSERFIPLAGIDMYGGLEYRFQSIPLAISINLKPFAELTFPAFVNMVPGDLGISLSYTF